MSETNLEPEVLTERVGSVAVLTLNRPERRNALDARLVAALRRSFEAVEADSAVSSVVLTGAGSSFCSGAVLDTLIASARGDFDSVIDVYEAFLRVLRSPLPVIAAVNGPAVGAGLNLALACDVRIASSSARFESRFQQLRLHPGGGHTWMLTRAVGRQTATLMALFGIPLDAGEAVERGLVAEAVAPEELRDRALELAARLNGMERPFVELTVRSLREAEQTLHHEEMLSVETDRQRWSTRREDFARNTTVLRDRISKR